jgi:hypothetical protein
MCLFAVGQQAPAPFWPSTGEDGAKFEQGSEGDWFIVFYMDAPSKEERRLVRKAKILTRYLTDDAGSMVFAMIRFKGSELAYELVHDPTKYPAIEWGKRVEMWDKSNMVTFLLIDSATGVIGAMRYANMPKVFWQVWRDSWRRALSIEDYTGKYEAWIKGLWEHKTLELWDMGTPAGWFGEEYQI